MKKTFLLGLLAAAIMTLTLTSCSPNVDTGTEPTILGALFVQASDISDNITWNTAINKEVKELSTTQNYTLCVRWNDPDLDVADVAICLDTKFNPYWHWDGFNFENPKTDMWVILGFNLTEKNLNYNPKSMFANITNRTLYVRVTDSKGNISAVYPITGVTIR